MHKIIWALFLGLLSNLASAGTPLTVAVYPGLDEAVKIAIPLYRKLHPEVEIQLVSQGYGEHHRAMIMALATGGEKEALPDVMGIGHEFIGKFEESGGLEDFLLPPYQAKPYRKLFQAHVFSKTLDSSWLSMPTSVYPKTLLYREDLLRKVGLSEKDLTGSWEAFIESGKKLKAETGACLVPDAAEIADLHVRAQVKERQGFYSKYPSDLCTGEMTSPRFAKAFELAQSVRQAGIDCRASDGSEVWWEGLKRDEIAGLLIGAQQVAELEALLPSNARGKWRVAQLPGRAFVLEGGDFYSIPKKARHKAEAWDFIKFLTLNASVQTEWARKTGAFPALLEAQTPELLIQPMAFLGGQAARKTWQASLKNIKAHSFDKYETVGREIVLHEVRQVLDGTKTIQTALKDAAAGYRPRCRCENVQTTHRFQDGLFSKEDLLPVCGGSRARRTSISPRSDAWPDGISRRSPSNGL